MCMFLACDISMNCILFLNTTHASGIFLFFAAPREFMSRLVCACLLLGGLPPGNKQVHTGK